MAGDLIEIINEEDEVIGLASRMEFFEKAILHRNVQVIFIDKNKKIIFQKRSEQKMIFAGLLDVTVSGGVEIGDNYEKTALKEAEEETGLILKNEQLICFGKKPLVFYDRKTALVSRAIRQIYGYIFDGNVEDLKIEENNGLGFELFSVEELQSLKPLQKERFIPGLLDDYYTNIYQELSHRAL